jgi:alpha-L-rhamnosidase
VNAPTSLRVEHFDAATLGIGERRPRLSWRLPGGAREQRSYLVEIDGRVHDEVASRDCLLVPWPSHALASRQRVEWRVKVQTDLGESGWSQTAWFETGLLSPDDWVATWVEPVEPVLAPSGQRPAHVLRTTFVLADRCDGRLYATAHGIYEAFLNGCRIGDRELTPGFTAYWANLHVQVYDVGDLLRAGENEWHVVLSDGWYRGRVGNWQSSENFGDRVAFLGQLHAGDAVVTSGEHWRSAEGAIRAADLMEGQAEDRRIEPREWKPVAVVDHDVTRLTYSAAPATRAVETVRPRAVRRLTRARQVVDLGQNINGRVQLRDLGPADTVITLVHGEVLDPDGNVTLANVANDHVCVAQTDTVVSAGRDGDVFEPRHTTHGFQFVQIDGHPHRLTPDDVSGVVVHTDLRRTGWFRCSDARINRFHEIADWSFRGNACEVPTDCPTRERAGFTGDWQLFLPSAAFLYDVAGFSLKWLRDLALDQQPDGCVLNVAPDPKRPRSGSGPDDYWRYIQGSAGWGDAIVMVPWDLYRVYGDHDVLDELWPAMVRWVEYAAACARTKRYVGRADARPKPAPHEQFLWDGGFHWGEWLEPGGLAEQFWAVDQGHVGTAFLHHSASLLAQIGHVLGRDDEATRFEELAHHTLQAWRAEYVASDGSLSRDTQAAHVRALAFDLVPDGLRARTAARLVELVREAGTHLGTGFLATPYLLPVLADSGHLDVAYDLLHQDTPPSWLAMVERGATTVWEDWEGVAADGSARASLNHYSKGAVISFLHRYVAGIELVEPGYRRFRVAPRPGGAITWAEAAHDCPYGRIESSWRVDERGMRMTVTVPPGTTAEVVLPDGTRTDQPPGVCTYEANTVGATTARGGNR